MRVSVSIRRVLEVAASLRPAERRGYRCSDADRATAPGVFVAGA